MRFSERVEASRAFGKVESTWKRQAEVLANKLRAILMAPELVQVRRQTRGKVDVKRIAQLAIGESDVFRKIMRGEGESLAVMVSIDGSSSMAASENYNAKCAALFLNIFNRAVGKVGGKFAAGVWQRPNYNEIEGMAKHGPTAKTRGSVWEENTDTAVFGMLKNFEQPWEGFDGKFHYADVNPAGGTPSVPGLLAALSVIGKRPEKKRILITITDGAGNGMHLKPTQNLYRQIEDQAAAAGITCITLSTVPFGDSVKRAYQKLICISPEELSTEGAKQLIRILKESRRERFSRAGALGS